MWRGVYLTRSVKEGHLFADSHFLIISHQVLSLASVRAIDRGSRASMDDNQSLQAKVRPTSPEGIRCGKNYQLYSRDNGKVC